jgi:hypothetical protein
LLVGFPWQMGFARASDAWRPVGEGWFSSCQALIRIDPGPIWV